MFKQLVVGASIAAMAVAAGTAGAAPERTEVLRLFDKPTSIQLTTAGGKVIDKPPYPEPKAGDVLDVYSLDFAGNHKRHSKRFVGSAHLRCEFGAGAPDCVSHTAIGGSLLIFSGNPGTLTAGTGRYAGATGRVLKNKEVKGGSDIVARIRLAR